MPLFTVDPRLDQLDALGRAIDAATTEAREMKGKLKALAGNRTAPGGARVLSYSPLTIYPPWLFSGSITIADVPGSATTAGGAAASTPPGGGG